MDIKLKKVEYIPSTQKEGSKEYEKTITRFEGSTFEMSEVICGDREISTLTSALRRAVIRMNKEDSISVVVRGEKVYLEKLKPVKAKASASTSN